MKQIRSGTFTPSEFWCLARLGSRRLFYGPNNQVLPATTVQRWIEAIVRIPMAAECLARLGQQTGDLTRDLPPGELELVRKALTASSDAESLLKVFESGESRDIDSMARVFGEELPSGLVLTRADANPVEAASVPEE